MKKKSRIVTFTEKKKKKKRSLNGKKTSMFTTEIIRTALYNTKN